MKRYGVIMAGGGGTRFWPLSRQAMPKQMLNLSGKDRMINETIDRLHDTVEKEDIFIVTNEKQAAKMLECVDGRIAKDHILAEPSARNTAACIGYAAMEIVKKYGDGIMCIFPSDHFIKNEPEFTKILNQAVQAAEEQEKELVQSALEFNDTTVEDILTPRVNMVAIDEESTPQEVLQIITEEGFSRIPVYSETVDHIIGVVHTRDILQAALLNKNFDIKKLMTEPMYVHRSMKIARLLSEFQRKKVHIAIVMDDYGGTLGIVTMEDVLEELVGEIYDERDEVVTEFTEVTPDTYEISGDMPVDDFLDEIDYHPADIEEDDYDTMNGLALSVLEHIPAVGETFQLGRLTFTVLEMEEQKIEKMRVILAPDSEKEAEKEKEKD